MDSPLLTISQYRFPAGALTMNCWLVARCWQAVKIIPIEIREINAENFSNFFMFSYILKKKSVAHSLIVNKATDKTNQKNNENVISNGRLNEHNLN
jgi:hypothetical protein